MYSNKYIFIYASVMVIVVAAVLSAAALYLKPFQEKNIKTEKIQEILAAANITSTKQNAIKLFGKYVTEEIVINRSGEILSIYKNGKFEKGTIRAFDIDLKVEQKNIEKLERGQLAPEPQLPLFICTYKGKHYYIIPLLGKGLWGPIWGNIALEEDFNTVAGVTFDHKSETPGLGAEINQEFFQVQFVGKKIFDQSGNLTSITLVKGGIEGSSIDPSHGVDAISGGTITSNGVTDMLKNCLSNYKAFIKLKKNEAKTI